MKPSASHLMTTQFNAVCRVRPYSRQLRRLNLC